MGKSYRMQIIFGVVTLLAAIIAVSSATYAWFTFSSDTNVEPLEGGIGYGEGNLLIANTPDGPFSDSCALSAFGADVLLQPLSTADLSTFYAARGQNRDGISIGFAQDENFAASAVCGTLYLKSELADSAVYFDRNALDFGSDNQALASMRLGLVITAQNKRYVHIFSLDSMGNTANAEERRTIEQPGAVVAAVDAAGKPDFVSDPAADIFGYCAKATDDPEYARPGDSVLCTLSADEVARVDYYLYLEGCDDNCINAVQGRMIALALGFTGMDTTEVPA
ncbi:MAG: hypothetical protein ACI3XZ_06660 [Butyricicoccus sp.]